MQTDWFGSCVRPCWNVWNVDILNCFVPECDASECCCGSSRCSNFVHICAIRIICCRWPYLHKDCDRCLLPGQGQYHFVGQCDATWNVSFASLMVVCKKGRKINSHSRFTRGCILLFVPMRLWVLFARFCRQVRFNVGGALLLTRGLSVQIIGVLIFVCYLERIRVNLASGAPPGKPEELRCFVIHLFHFQ